MGIVTGGGLLNNKKSGYGVLIYSNGDRYEGEFRDDQRSGRGKLINRYGVLYDGQWRDDKYNGHGVASVPSGMLDVDWMMELPMAMA